MFSLIFMTANYTKKINCIHDHEMKGMCLSFTLVPGYVVVAFLFIVTPIVGVCNCSMFCCTLLYVHSSIAIILMGKRELVWFA